MEPATDALPVREAPLPALTPPQMRALDDELVDEVGLHLLAMMENAGARLARAVRRVYPEAQTVAVLAGKGNNGGGGLAAARHLANAGREVTVLLAAAGDELGPAPARQARILDHAEVPVRGTQSSIPTADVIVDALLGYAQQGDPRGAVRERVEQAAGRQAPVVALDVPTGLDPATGEWAEPALRPDVTLTLALPKTGLVEADPSPGVPLLADIGVPRGLYADRGVQPPPFVEGPLVRWRPELAPENASPG